MSYDIIGSIAVLKNGKKSENKKLAKRILNERKSIKTVLVKEEKVKGRLRTYKTKWLAGEKTTLATYKENNCVFKLDIEKCYFSSRLAGERKEIAELILKEIKKNKIKKPRILVLFSGVGPYPIVIAKNLEENKVKNYEIISVELGKACCKYAKENIRLNKLDKIEIIQGDVKKLKKLLKKERFDFVVMPRPRLKESFLSYVLKFIKKRSKIYYYDFGKQEELGKILAKIKISFDKSGKKYKIIKIKKAGEIAPYKFRFRVDLIIK